MAPGGTWSGSWKWAGLSQAQWWPSHGANVTVEQNRGQVLLQTQPDPAEDSARETRLAGRRVGRGPGSGMEHTRLEPSTT